MMGIEVFVGSVQEDFVGQEEDPREEEGSREGGTVANKACQVTLQWSLVQQLWEDELGTTARMEFLENALGVCSIHP